MCSTGVYLPAQKRNVWEVARKYIFVMLANCFAHVPVLRSPLLSPPATEGGIRRGFFPHPFWPTMHSNVVDMLAGWETSTQPCWIASAGSAEQISISQEVEKLLQKANFWFILWP